MPSRVLFLVLCALVGLVLGERYIGRLPNHDGYFLVPVRDEVKVPIPVRPRHTVLIVVDGLRRDAAETMSSTRALRQAGQCRISDQGSYTISRPEYALLSTGLEVDRSGSRNNDLTAPLAAESVWQVARANGLRVAGSSHLPWFRQLFPDGFDQFTMARAHADDVFAASELLDVDVFHPLYVDEAAHRHGAASPEYAAAVARADGEIARLLARLDLARDLVVLTADHGHRAQGGHGGAQPEVKDVLACFAGPNVVKLDGRPAFDGRSTAPLLALMMGIPFPRHMRAGDDGLDVLWEIARADAANAAYLDDRRAAVARFRAENRVALEGWLGGSPGTWPRLYEREASRHRLRFGLVLAAVTAFVANHVRRGRRARSSGRLLGWLAFVAFAIWSSHHLVLGDFDYTVINLRERFLVRAFGAVLLSAAMSVAAHAIGVRRRERMANDLHAVLVLLLFANLGHIFVYGWPLGFPLPPPAARYFPFFGAIALVGYASVAFAIVMADWRAARRVRRLTP